MNAEKVSPTAIFEEIHLVSGASSEPKLKCDKWDLNSLSPVKLKIHTRCVHSRKKETLMEKYDNTKHYWETGKIGISYQSFLESRFLIDACLPQKSRTYYLKQGRSSLV